MNSKLLLSTFQKNYTTMKNANTSLTPLPDKNRADKKRLTCHYRHVHTYCLGKSQENRTSLLRGNVYI